MRRPSRQRSLSEVSAELEVRDPRLVLVDCFGTLLHRSIPSGQVRELAARELIASLGLGTEIGSLLAARRSAERALAGPPDGPARDHSCRDLARLVHERMADPGLPDVDTFVGLFCGIELGVERMVTTPNDPLASVLGGLGSRTRVVVLSDTNLTSAMLRDLLEDNGIGEIVGEVIASCDSGGTKRSGELYRIALEKTGLDPSDAVMIGDNPDVDGEMAERAGLRAMLIQPGRWDGIKESPPAAIRRDVQRKLRDLLAPAADTDVFPEIALTLWLFTSRLDSALRCRGSGPAVFLAREGLFLRELFDDFQAFHTHDGRRPIASSYLLTSRRASFLPGLADLDRQLHSLVGGSPGLTTGDLAALLGLSVERLTGVEDPDELLTDPVVERLLGSEDLVDELAARRSLQRELLRELVDGAAGSDADIQTVDVGWKGTVRDQLAVALGNRSIHANLLGLSSQQSVQNLSDKTGLLFSNQPGRSHYFQVFSHFKELYEVLLAAPHGSVSHYERGIGGGVEAVLDENPAETACHVAHIAPCQAVVRRRFVEVSRTLAHVREEPTWLEELVARHHARMMYRPLVTELEFVEDLVQFENFGAGRVKGLGSASTTSPRWLDPRRFISGGGWPPLRMQRAGAAWQRGPYGAAKRFQAWRGSLR